MARRLKVSIGKQTSRVSANARFGREYTTTAIASGKRITDAILDIFDQLEDASEELMLEALEPTLELSATYCPKDTLKLVNSRYLEVASFRGKPRVEIGYARGGIPDYGAYVHEATWVPHKEPTRAKFLEAAVFEDLDNIYKRLGQGYSKFMGAQ